MVNIITGGWLPARQGLITHKTVVRLRLRPGTCVIGLLRDSKQPETSRLPDWKSSEKAKRNIILGFHVLRLRSWHASCELEFAKREGKQAAVQVHQYSCMHGSTRPGTEDGGRRTMSPALPERADAARPIARAGEYESED